MKRVCKSIRAGVLCALCCMFVLPQPVQSQCADAAQRGHLTILTINILYSQFVNRSERLRSVADFIADQAAADEPVDIVLLQEAVSGLLAGTVNISLNLAAMLKQQGIDYTVRFRPVTGIPGIFMVGNAMLSRCGITRFASRLLPFAPERPLGGPGVPLLHEVQMISTDIPSYGSVDVYNTHLCAFCDGSERLVQTNALMQFMEQIESVHTPADMIILAGDFNTDVAVASDAAVYALITEENGFTDTYAAMHACTDCCSAQEGYEGCTYAVEGNPLGGGSPPVRIDYIFARGQDITVLDSSVVFNAVPWVSDHSGVLTRISLP